MAPSSSSSSSIPNSPVYRWHRMVVLSRKAYKDADAYFGSRWQGGSDESSTEVEDRTLFNLGWMRSGAGDMVTDQGAIA
jgi:hypothetical protein